MTARHAPAHARPRPCDLLAVLPLLGFAAAYALMWAGVIR